MYLLLFFFFVRRSGGTLRRKEKKIPVEKSEKILYAKFVLKSTWNCVRLFKHAEKQVVVILCVIIYNAAWQ